MNLKKTVRFIVVGACAAMLAFVLSGCASTQTTSTDDEASQNRQYMALLNQQMDDLQTTLDSFQKAVAQKDTVSMKAQVANISKTLDDVKNTDCTERLQTVKDGYVDGLCTLQDSLNAYVTLYTDVSNGAVDDATYQQRLTQVQTSYDNGIAKLKSADEAVRKIAEE